MTMSKLFSSRCMKRLRFKLMYLQFCSYLKMLEEWDRNAVFTLRGQRIAIVPSPTEMLLCVGRLPISYTEQQFHNMVSIYGEVRRYFLMISEKSGKVNISL